MLSTSRGAGQPSPWHGISVSGLGPLLSESSRAEIWLAYDRPWNSPKVTPSAIVACARASFTWESLAVKSTLRPYAGAAARCEPDRVEVPPTDPGAVPAGRQGEVGVAGACGAGVVGVTRCARDDEGGGEGQRAGDRGGGSGHRGRPS